MIGHFTTFQYKSLVPEYLGKTGLKRNFHFLSRSLFARDGMRRLFKGRRTQLALTPVPQIGNPTVPGWGTFSFWQCAHADGKFVGDYIIAGQSIGQR